MPARSRSSSTRPAQYSAYGNRCKSSNAALSIPLPRLPRGVLGSPQRSGASMTGRKMTALAAAGCLAALALPRAADAQQSGGVLKFYHRDSPASMSILEEATISSVAPMMGVFNNLNLFNQQEKQN